MDALQKWPEGPARLAPQLRVKALDRAGLVESLGANPSTVNSWLCGARRPGPDKMRRIADLFDLPLDYLYGAPCPHLADRTHEAIAARASLDIFLQRAGESMPAEMQVLLRSFLESVAAPRSVAEWRALVSDILDPAFHFGQRQHRVLAKMLLKVDKHKRTKHPPQRSE